MSSNNISLVNAWILDRAATCHVFLETVMYSPEDLRRQWNDAGTNMDGWTQRGMKESLLELCEEQQIAVTDRLGGRVLGFHECRSNFVEEGDASAEQSSRALCYHLTRKGATQWESVFRPDWNRFFEWTIDPVPDGRERCQLCCGSEDQMWSMIDGYVEYCRCDRVYGIQQLVTKKIKKWRATYWKTIDIGYRASFFVMPQPALARFLPENAPLGKVRSVFVQWGRPLSWKGGVPDSVLA